MRVHHLNCGTMCPRGGRLVNGDGGYFSEARMVCHVLLVETEEGLVLVDTGLGTADVREPRRRLNWLYLASARPRLREDETALRQVEKLGFRADDVRHVVPTHLDLDHIGGLSDFPKAQVHVYEAEWRRATSPAGFQERHDGRYQAIQWAHGPRWTQYRVQGEPWFGFEAVRSLQGLPPEILLVPLPGHSRGHCCVAVQAGPGWLLHCGDAYFHHGEMDPRGRRCTPGLELFQRVVQDDPALRRSNQERLRVLARDHASQVRVFSAHDPHELEQLQASPSAPVPQA